jgi:acetyl esterase/lipase
VVLAFHGGGFVTGSMYAHRKLFGHLAKAISG